MATSATESVNSLEKNMVSKSTASEAESFEDVIDKLY